MTDKESFKGGLELWHIKWKPFLNERSISLKTGKSYYTHKRLRSVLEPQTSIPDAFNNKIGAIDLEPN